MSSITIGFIAVIIGFISAMLTEIGGLVLHPAYWFLWGGTTGMIGIYLIIKGLIND